MDGTGEELVGRWLPMGTPTPLIPAKACPVLRYGAGIHPRTPRAPTRLPREGGGSVGAGDSGLAAE